MVLWQVLHPAVREAFVEAAAPPPIPRVHYATDDGWCAPLFHIPPAPGGAGEPVIVAHGLGLGADAFRYGAGATFAGALAASGFSVYLLAYRGDRDAVGPGPWRFDDVVERDVPAAIDAVRAHAGFDRVHWIGHGLGGQVALAHASRTGGAGLASLVTLGAAVGFCGGEVEGWLSLGSLLPSRWRVPLRRAGRLSAALVDATPQEGLYHAVPAPRLRGLARFALEDLPIGLLRQLQAWGDAGRLVDSAGERDLTLGLAEVDLPLLSVTGGGDGLCPPAAAVPEAAEWGGEVTRLELPERWGHLDLVLAEGAAEAVYEPVCAWLAARRRLAWTDEPEAPAIEVRDRVQARRLA